MSYSVPENWSSCQNLVWDLKTQRIWSCGLGNASISSKGYVNMLPSIALRVTKLNGSVSILPTIANNTVSSYPFSNPFANARLARIDQVD